MKHSCESLNKCIDVLQKRTEVQDRALQEVQHEFVESRRQQARLQEELFRKEKAFWDTQIRSMHELEKMKRAQVQQVDEMSIQKLRENHETIQQLTSQLQQLQEQMNSMNGSGEFQDIESNYSGRLSHVSSQPEMIPCSRALLSRDKRLPLDTWNQSGVQENVFGNQFSTFDSPKGFPQRSSSDNVQRNREAIPHQPKVKSKSDKWRRTKLWHNSNADFCVKTVDCQFCITDEITAELCGRTAKTANVGITNSTNSLLPHHSWCGRPDS